MVDKLKGGVEELNKLAYQFAHKQQVQIDHMILDNGHVQWDSEPHLLEIGCCGKRIYVYLTNHEIINFTIAAKHKLIMGLMQLMPLDSSSVS